jgi:hypothetical protein
MFWLFIQSNPYSLGSSHPDARGVTTNVFLLQIGEINADGVAEFENPYGNVIDLLDSI